MDCAAIAERIVTKMTVRVVPVILWSRILVNFVGVMAVFWSLVGRAAVLRTVHFLLVVVIARTVYVAASRTVIGYVTVVTVVIVRTVNVYAALGSDITHVVIVVTTFVHVVPSVT